MLEVYLVYKRDYRSALRVVSIVERLDVREVLTFLFRAMYSGRTKIELYKKRID